VVIPGKKPRLPIKKKIMEKREIQGNLPHKGEGLRKSFIGSASISSDNTTGKKSRGENLKGENRTGQKLGE